MRKLKFLSSTCLAMLLAVSPAFGQQTGSTTMQDDASRQGQTQTAPETQTQGAQVQETGEKKIEERQKVAREAAEVMQAMTTGTDRKVPAPILESARAVAVIPDVTKAAFIAGGRFGEGLMLARKADGSWSDTPTYVEIGGASVGFQAGVTESDLVILFMGQEAVESILDGKLEFGGEIAAVAGPNDADASFTVQSGEPIYTYSRSGGLFAGVSLDGAYLSIDSSANQDVYGKDVTARQLLVESGIQPQTSGIVEPFVQSVQRIQARSVARADTQTGDRDPMMTDRDLTETTRTIPGETEHEVGETAREAGETARDAGETAHEAGETAHDAGESVAEGVGEAAQEAGETAHEAGESAAEGVGEAAEEVGDTAQEAGKTVREGVGEAAEETGDAAEEAGQTAREAGETVTQEAGQTADEAERSAQIGESEDDRGDNAQVIRDAAEVVREMTQSAGSKIPASVMQNAHAIAVIPNMVEGAAIVGGSFGEGVIVAKTDGGNWGRTPAFIDVGGASAGLQLGATETDLILVFSTKESFEHVLDGKFELGAEASVVAGPTGASADTTGTSGPIYAYTRKEGAYAGAALEGAVINIDDSANKEVYGSEMSARDLLTGQAGQQAQGSAIVQPLLDALSADATRRAE